MVHSTTHWRWSLCSGGRDVGSRCVCCWKQVPFLKLTASWNPWKFMVGRWSIPCGARPIFRGELLVAGSVSIWKLTSPKKREHFKRQVVFEPWFVRGYVKSWRFMYGGKKGLFNVPSPFLHQDDFSRTSCSKDGGIKVNFHMSFFSRSVSNTWKIRVKRIPFQKLRLHKVGPVTS